MGISRNLFILVTLICTFLLPGKISAQQAGGDSLVQFSGLVLSSDSLMGLEGVSIRRRGSYFGTSSNSQGIFTLVAERGDTVIFSSIGYKTEMYVVPTTLTAQRYSMIITLTSDTLWLNTVVVKPFISQALLQHYFVTMDIPEDEDLAIARRNLEAELLRQQAAAMGADGPENADLVIRQEAAKYYYSGQTPPINILNPFAWAQFINAWKRGDFKKKK